MAHDLLYFEFETLVPNGVEGYRFDFSWFSSEYPEWVGTQYNDVFMVWAVGGEYTGNMSFIGDQPLTATALADHIRWPQSSPRLDGTGYEGVGGSTGWVEARGVATPGETLRLDLRHLRHGGHPLRHHRPDRQLSLGVRRL